MALILGDVHGYYEKLKAFLEYKPEEEHLLTGDLMDAYNASDETICKTFELFIQSSALATWSNHDITYVHKCPSELACSGHRNNPAFGHLINGNKDKYVGSFIRDNYLITHGGISKGFGERFDTIEALSEYINAEIDKVVNLSTGEVVQRPLSDVFSIDFTRGGYGKYGGPLWADYRTEHFDNRFNQVFGHTHRDKPKILDFSKLGYDTKFAAIDCSEWYCFNTKTGELEDYMPEKWNNSFDRYKLEVNY